jgi:hypothetical protein
MYNRTMPGPANAERCVPPPSANGSNGESPPSPPATDGRDPASGRFLPGNKHGRGNPFCRQLAARRKALLDAVSPEDIAQVARRLFVMAAAGDVAAAALLLKYVVGQPAQAPDPDRLDVEEFDLLRRAPGVRELADLCSRVATGYAALRVLESQAGDEEAYGKRLEQELAYLGEEVCRMDPDGALLGKDDGDEGEDDPKDDPPVGGGP